MDNILTVKDVAGILKVRDITVREMFRAQRLRGFKIGKSWRTTQKLFEEDLAALMSGRAPETMPTPKAPAKPRKKAKRSASKEPAPAPESMADPAVEETSALVESEAAPTSTIEHEPPVASDPPEWAEEDEAMTVEEVDAESDGKQEDSEEPQRLLF